MDQEGSTDLMATLADQTFEFVRLSDLPEMTEACAKFHASQSGEQSDDGMQMRKAAFQKLSLDGEEEDAVLALFAQGQREGQIAALAVLVAKEMEAFDDLGPWLTGLMVSNCCEQESVKQALCQEIENLADELGYAQIFVQTSKPGFFEAQGYAEIEPFEKDGTDYMVLGKAL